ncbi:MAG: class I SAM-dependent methyltransferase [Patescibacteria group bacterium]|nr:class I SAM-dependent methyltransferase [Patescibacteria group bacterium]
MKQVDSKVYNKNYYLNVCLGSELYKNSKGKKINEKWEKILKLIDIKPGMNILDLGCGRGDVDFYLARKGVRVIGIDYSKDAIELCNKSLKNMPKKIKNLVSFYNMDAKKIEFKDDSFDCVISLDVFEHLYKEELEVVMKNLSKVLKRNGILFVHTETNRIYLDYTHKFYVYPVSHLLIKVNKIFFKKEYSGLSKDARNEYHKIQHVNEPTIFYLRKLFKRHSFKGKIISNAGLLKPIFSWKDYLYNILVCFYPISFYFPFNILFATDYICIVRNEKK